MILHTHLMSSTGATSVTETREPKKALVGVVETLKANDDQVEADFHPETGSVRILSTSSSKGLSTSKFNNDPIGHAQRTIKSKNIAKALELSDCDLAAGKVVEFAFGYRVAFNQVHTVRGRRTPVPVRAGFVHVHMLKDGTVFQIVNTLRHGSKPKTLGKLTTRAQAIEHAKAKMAEILAKNDLAKEEAQKQSGLGEKLGGVKLSQMIDSIDLAALDNGRLTQLINQNRGVVDKGTTTVQLVFSTHEDSMDPIYEVKLSVGEPRVLWSFLVHAKTGEVVHDQNLLHFAAPAGTGKSVRVKTLYRVPDPTKAIEGAIKDGVIDTLPDPKVLKNEFFEVYMGGDKSKPVKAKADGTFNYTSKDPEFAAVVTFFALNLEIRHLIKMGLKAPTSPIPVYVQDPGVQDNAYFDPSDPQLRGGVGSGLKRGGLNVMIAYDLTVFWHECGHYMVFLQTPGNDLPGSEGGAMHESTGDMMAIAMGYLFRIWFAKELGETFTLKELKADRRVVGEYALPPDGIRIQRGTKKTPDDKEGEVHADGLISGQAHGDMLEALCSKAGVGLEDGINSFLTIYMMALSLVPAHKVTFRDMLRCMVNADAQLNKGANRKLIEDAHAAHGIKLSGGGSAGDNSVVIITTKRRRRRTA